MQLTPLRTAKSSSKTAKSSGNVDGRTMWLDVQTKEPCQIDEDMKSKFKQYWTVEYDNYPVYDHYLKVPDSNNREGERLK